jgi:putative ABC transport system ATP-binding protein
MKRFIEVEHVSKGFLEAGVRREVLHTVSVTINTGEFVVLLGRSGSGKSTLLNLVSGIDAPDSGRITVNGQDLTAMNERDRTLFRRSQIGFVFQFFNLVPTLTVLENLLLPLELNGRADANGHAHALALLGRVGLADRKDVYPDKLSGGEQQRIAIARALVHDPALVLADEPTGNLDVETGQLVLELLDTLTRQAGKTLLMVTHSTDIAALADRVLRVVDGRLVEDVLQIQR